MRPQAVILAGPNGAGKSTAQKQLVAPTIPFVNADNIARSLRDEGRAIGPAADVAAGRILLAELDSLVRAKQDFATETNLANQTLARRIPHWQAMGYRVTLIYLWVPSPEFSIARVAQRVRSGGHDVPEETIRRRYYLGLKRFFESYQDIVDDWQLYDSSQVGNPVLIARVEDRLKWNRVRELASMSLEENDAGDLRTNSDG